MPTTLSDKRGQSAFYFVDQAMSEPTKRSVVSDEEAGASRVIVQTPGLTEEREATEHLERIAEILGAEFQVSA